MEEIGVCVLCCYTVVWRVGGGELSGRVVQRGWGVDEGVRGSRERVRQGSAETPGGASKAFQLR